MRTVAGFDSGIWFRIVGVVDDVRHISLTRDPVPEMYRPIAQTAVPMVTFVVRTAGDAAAMTPAARAAVQAADPNLPIYDVRTMDDRVASSFAQTRATMLLLLATAALAAALAGVAIYGSIWYSVSQRCRRSASAWRWARARASVFVGVLRRAIVLALTRRRRRDGVLDGDGPRAGGAAVRHAGDRSADLRRRGRRRRDADDRGEPVPARRAMSVDPMIALRNE